MPRRGHTEEQILQALRLAESGTKAVEVCRRMGISEQTFYTWRRKYAGLGLSELRQLRDENTKMKRPGENVEYILIGTSDVFAEERVRAFTLWEGWRGYDVTRYQELLQEAFTPFEHFAEQAALPARKIS